ncbi:MAG: DUF4276 family protein [Phycisphaerae bacterium]
MIRVNIVVEGQTEETFVNEVLAPALGYRGVYLTPRLLGAPGKQGGNVNYARVRMDVSAFLKQDKQAYCTTLIDLYGLGNGFPGNDPTPIGVLRRPEPGRASQIEQAVKSDIISTLGDNWRADIRFIPYIQQYEFEGLLFSDPVALAQGISQPQLANKFQAVRVAFATPEEINDSPHTAPSKRILQIHPPYQKLLHGVLAAKKIGFGTMRRECPRFNAWISRLEALGTGGA